MEIIWYKEGRKSEMERRIVSIPMFPWTMGA